MRFTYYDVMRLGGKFVLSIVVTGLILSGCQAASKPPQASPQTSAGTAPKAPNAAPGPAKSHSIAVPAPVRTSTGMVAELAPTKTSKFAMLGVTWDRTDNDQDVTVDVRVRKDDGWSDWETLEVDHDGGEAGRGGTEPWWVENADEVGARVITASGASPTGVKVVTIDPGAGDTPDASISPAFYSSSSTSSVVAAAAVPPTFTPRPAIITRASWKARAPVGCGNDGYSAYGDTTQGVNIHHSAGSNSYTKKQSAAIVRGIQKFHQSGRGWCDIAYNFLVDKYGQIFEGRAGGVDRPVRGSHSGNNRVNERTMGVALIGNLDKARTTTPMRASTIRLVGWRLATYYWPAKGLVNIGGKTLNRISGHRNVVSTACPGKYGYAWIGEKERGLRDRVAVYISNYNSKIKTAVMELDGHSGSKTGYMQRGEQGYDTQRLAVFSKMDFLWLSPSPRAYYVAGTARTVYHELGFYKGVLGFPMENLTASSTISGLSIQPFQHGAIYQVPSGTFGLYGDIHETYESVDGPGGDLGLPASGIVVSGTTKTATFEHGTITQVGTAAPEVHLNAPARGAPSPQAPETTEPTVPTPSTTEEGIEPNP